MSEPIDSQKSEPQKKESLTGQDVWNPLLRRQKEGSQLTTEEQRALEIRATSISCINALDQLLNNPAIKDDVLTEADTVARYWDALFKLQDMGIEANMKTNEAVEFYRNPLNAAEYVAGQLVNNQRNNLPDARKAVLEAQEHSKGNDSVNSKILQYEVPTKMLSKNALEFNVLNTTINLLRLNLADEAGNKITS